MKYKFYIQRYGLKFWDKAKKTYVTELKSDILDIEEYFKCKYVRFEGLTENGKQKNLYTESFAEAPALRMYVPSTPTYEPTTITLTLLFLKETDSHDVLSNEKRFVDFVTSRLLEYHDTFRNVYVSMYLSEQPETVSEKLYGDCIYREVKFKFKNIYGTYYKQAKINKNWIYQQVFTQDFASDTSDVNVNVQPKAISSTTEGYLLLDQAMQAGDRTFSVFVIPFYELSKELRWKVTWRMAFSSSNQNTSELSVCVGDKVLFTLEWEQRATSCNVLNADGDVVGEIQNIAGYNASETIMSFAKDFALTYEYNKGWQLNVNGLPVCVVNEQLPTPNNLVFNGVLGRAVARVAIDDIVGYKVIQ